MCRVVTSKDALYGNPLEEVGRIVKELKERCGLVTSGTKDLTVEHIEAFVDMNLSHGGRSGEDGEKTVLARHGDCVVYDYSPRTLIKRQDIHNWKNNNQRRQDRFHERRH